MANKLPPLPPSSDRWWKGARIESIPIEPIRKCEHEFELTKDGAKCMKCNLEFLGEGFEVQDGILRNSKKPAL